MPFFISLRQNSCRERLPYNIISVTLAFGNDEIIGLRWKGITLTKDLKLRLKVLNEARI